MIEYRPYHTYPRNDPPPPARIAFSVVEYGESGAGRGGYLKGNQKSNLRPQNPNNFSSKSMEYGGILFFRDNYKMENNYNGVIIVDISVGEDVVFYHRLRFLCSV